MNLTATVQRAKDAASKAKPFMRLMDALSDLERDLREAAALETNAEATAKKKADLEAAIPALQSEKNALQHTVNSHKAEMAAFKTKFDQDIIESQKLANAALAAKHAQIEAEHQAKITALKGEISTLGGTISALQTQKTEIEAQIGALRKSIEGARAAFHV